MTLLKDLKERLKPTNSQPTRQFYDRFVKQLTDAEQTALAHALDSIIKGEHKDLTDETWLATRPQEEQTILRKVFARLESKQMEVK